MSGINVLMLQRDFTLSKKKVSSNASHVHFGRGSYLNMEKGIRTTQDCNAPPVLIFQEGNAVPKGAIDIPEVPTEKGNPRQTQQIQHPLENVKWGAWYIPMLRGLNRQHHGGTDFMAIFKQLVNLKTLPFWLIGFALLSQFLGG